MTILQRVTVENATSNKLSVLEVTPDLSSGRRRPDLLPFWVAPSRIMKCVWMEKGLWEHL